MKKMVLFVLFMPSLLASTTHSTPARAKKEYFDHYPPTGPVKEYPSRWQDNHLKLRTVHKVILMSDPEQYWKSRINGDAAVINRLFNFYTVPVKHHPEDTSNTQYHFLF